MMLGLLPMAVMAAESVEVVISDAELMTTLLPASGTVKQQSLPVDEQLRDWVEQKYGFTPEPQQLNIWLSRDQKSGRLLGGMIKADIVYQEQTITLALGLSHELRVSRAAIVALPSDLRPALDASIGVGFLKRYTMMSARQLRYLANVLQKEGQPTALVAESLFKYGAMLAAVIKMH